MGRLSSGEVIKLKKNFEVNEKLGAFYSGGPVQLSKDGQYVFTTCGNGVKVLSYGSGRVQYTIEEEEDHVTCFVVSDNGEWLVIGWRSLLLKQYNWKTGECTRSWKGHIAPVMSMAFDTSSTLLATGSSDSIINVWDCEKQYCTHNFRGSKGVVNLVRFHPDQNNLKLLTSSADCNIRVWDLNTSKCVMVLKGHVSTVTCLSFSEDWQILISGGRDQVVHIWNFSSAIIKQTIPTFESVEGLVTLPSRFLEQEGPIKLALEAEKHRKTTRPSKGLPVLFATAGNKGKIRVWSTEKKHALCTLGDLPISPSDSDNENEDIPSYYTGLHYNETMGILAGVTYDQNIIFFDSKTLRILKLFVGYLDEVVDMCFVGQSESLLAVATNSEQVKVFERTSLSCQLLIGHKGTVLSLDASTDGTLLATGSKDNTIRIWKLDLDSNQFECVGVGAGHWHAVGAVAISRLSGGFVVSASQDCTMKVWSLRRTLAVPKEAEVVGLKVKYTKVAHEKDINSLDVSPNDKLVVTGSQDKTAKLWQTVDGSLLGVLRGHRRGLWSVKFSPVDQCVLTASGDATIKLWTINDFSCIKTFESHTNSVLKAIFLTRGMQIASSGSDGLVKLWTIKTNECVATLDEHTEKIWSLAATSDGQVLMSGGADSLICQWKNTTEEVESQKAAELEVRLLQEQELSNLLRQKDYVKAVGVAISLEQPNRVLSLLQDLLEKCGLNDDFVDTIQRLRDDQICSVLKYVNSWNQNARHSHVAQSVLTVVLRKYTHEELVKMEGTRSLLEGLIPYTERHLRRVTRLQQLSKFVEYTLQCMKLPSLPTPHDVSDNQVAMETDPVSVISADSTTNFQDEDVGCHDNFDDPENHVTSTTDYSSKTKIMSKRFIRKNKLKEHLRRKSALSIKRSISKINRSTRKTKLKRLS